jgi:pimeloyl-ACP methyl ester carboxylesterase
VDVTTRSRRIRSALIALLIAVRPAVGLAQWRSGTTSTGIFYESMGSGEPVVLVHAFSVDRRMWNPQVSALKERFMVIRYDLRGHGNSAAPSVPYAAYEDLRGVLDTLGIRRAALVGLSAGSQVAIDFAIAYPDRVTRMVLASSGLSGYRTSTPLTWMQPVFQAAAAGDAERAATLWSQTPIMTLRADTSTAATLKALALSNAKLWSYKTNPDQGLRPPAIGRLSEIRSPTLVIVGGGDLPHIMEIADLLVKGIAGAKLVTIAAAGHFVNLDAGQRFNEELIAFLVDDDRSPRGRR